MHLRTKQIVKKARGEMSQSAFARLLSKNQSAISKYERGAINPPAYVIDACLEMIEKNGEGVSVSSSALAKRIRRELSGADYLATRKAIEAVLDSVK